MSCRKILATNATEFITHEDENDRAEGNSPPAAEGHDRWFYYNGPGANFERDTRSCPVPIDESDRSLGAYSSAEYRSEEGGERRRAISLQDLLQTSPLSYEPGQRQHLSEQRTSDSMYDKEDHRLPLLGLGHLFHGGYHHPDAHYSFPTCEEEEPSIDQTRNEATHFGDIGRGTRESLPYPSDSCAAHNARDGGASDASHAYTHPDSRPFDSRTQHQDQRENSPPWWIRQPDSSRPDRRESPDIRPEPNSALDRTLRARRIFSALEDVCTLAARNFYLSQVDSPFEAAVHIDGEESNDGWGSTRKAGLRSAAEIGSTKEAVRRAKEGSLRLGDYLQLISSLIWERASSGRGSIRGTAASGDTTPATDVGSACATSGSGACLEAVHRLGNLWHWGGVVVEAVRESEENGSREQQRQAENEAPAPMPPGTVNYDTRVAEDSVDRSVWTTVMAARDLVQWLLCEEAKREVERLWVEEWLGLLLENGRWGSEAHGMQGTGMGAAQRDWRAS